MQYRAAVSRRGTGGRDLAASRASSLRCRHSHFRTPRPTTHQAGADQRSEHADRDSRAVSDQQVIDLSPNDSPEIQAMVRDIIDTNRYMVLGTTEPSGLPRLSPVYYTHHEHRVVYWVSGVDAQHSENIVRQPAILSTTPSTFEEATPHMETELT